MKKKKCSKCKVEKPLSEFYRDKSAKSGYLSWCKKCNIASAIARQKADPEKVYARNKEYSKKHPERVREYKLKQTFGITLKDYNKIWNNQNGLCAVCGEPETAVRNKTVVFLSVDHDHKTGKMRGLLCHRCNSALGFADDNIKRLTNLVEYLKCHQGS